MTARWDLWAFAGTGIAVVIAIAYLVIIDAQDDTPAYWFLALVVLAACAGLYAARKDSPARKQVLLAAAVVLFGLGLLALVSVGLPLIMGGVCLLIASLRATRVPVVDP